MCIYIYICVYIYIGIYIYMVDNDMNLIEMMIFVDDNEDNDK